VGLFVCLLVSSSSLSAVEETSEADLGPIRKLRGQHLTLFTDLPASPAIDDLPRVFDLAVDHWANYFGCDRSQLDEWHVIGSLIRDKQRFRDYGLFPDSLPPFLHGYQRHDEIWVYEQPGDYYTRHLLLHEGTHAIMSRQFGRAGPDWYREGIAELLATHRYEDGRLQLGYLPAHRDEVEQWGRIKIVNDQVGAGQAKSISQIMALPSRKFLQVEAYAWTWAFATFCDHHPVWQGTFRGLQSRLRSPAPAVTAAWSQAYRANQARVDAAWNLFLANLDYGYELAADEIHYTETTRELTSTVATATIDVAKGWQSTGLLVPAGSQLIMAAKGRYQVGKDPRPWWCEPQGVTIEYYRRRPLGMLIGSFATADGDGLSDSFVIGNRKRITTKHGGVLFLRINERAGGLGDNRGNIAVRIKLEEK
jgi:hypothetical protein